MQIADCHFLIAMATTISVAFPACLLLLLGTGCVAIVNILILKILILKN